MEKNIRHKKNPQGFENHLRPGSKFSLYNFGFTSLNFAVVLLYLREAPGRWPPRSLESAWRRSSAGGGTTGAAVFGEILIG